MSSLDTIHSIALKFKMTTGELLRLNGLPSTYRIYSGQHLTVFENSTSGAPEITTRTSTDKPTVSLDGLTGISNLGSFPQGSDGTKSPLERSTPNAGGSIGQSIEVSATPLSLSSTAVPTVTSPTVQAVSPTTTASVGLRGSGNQVGNRSGQSPAPRISETDRSTTPPCASTSNQRQLSTTDLKMSFTNVITPSYKSVPLLVLLRQSRDKNYFGDGKMGGASGVYGVNSGVSDSLTATMAKQSPSHVSRMSSTGFLSIPDEMRLSSRDLVKEHVRYYINEQRNVFGELTLTPSSIFFEPALDDPVTRQLGLLQCQIQCDLKDILDVHIIEAAEVLGWWKSKGSTSSASSQGQQGYNSASSSASNSPGVSTSTSASPPPQTKRPRALSHSGPSSTHLSTGTYGNNGNSRTSPSASPVPQIDSHRFLDDGPDRNPRFLQLTVLLGKPDSGTQTGKIVYFLINRQSIDIFYQKLEIWCAQARPSTAGSGPRKTGTSILTRPQDKHQHQQMNDGRERHNSSPAPFDGSTRPDSSSSSAAAAVDPSKSSSYVVADAETPKLNLPSALLTNDVTLQRMAGALPVRLRHSNWTLLYSTERHGVSLTTFFNKTKRKGPSYLVVEDDAGFRFGAFISDSWEPQRSYYGTGECFLFTLYPSFNVYPWSQLNEYFVYSKEDTIALGGGSGKFGLWLDADLLQGSSAPCDTFLNSTLSCQEDFKPMIVEVWGFDDVIKP